jgi:hypothetical protein
MATVTAFVISPRTGFEGGRRTIAFELTDGAGWHDRETWELLGPATPLTSGGPPMKSGSRMAVGDRRGAGSDRGGQHHAVARRQCARHERSRTRRWNRRAIAWDSTQAARVRLARLGWSRARESRSGHDRRGATRGRTRHARGAAGDRCRGAGRGRAQPRPGHPEHWTLVEQRDGGMPSRSICRMPDAGNCASPPHAATRGSSASSTPTRCSRARTCGAREGWSVSRCSHRCSAASVLGSLHCAAMCGGFVCAVSAQGRPLASQTAWHLGRGIVYLSLGALGRRARLGLRARARRVRAAACRRHRRGRVAHRERRHRRCCRRSGGVAPGAIPPRPRRSHPCSAARCARCASGRCCRGVSRWAP